MEENKDAAASTGGVPAPEASILFGQKDFVSSAQRVLHLCMPTRGVNCADLTMWIFNATTWVTRMGIACLTFWKAQGAPVAQAREMIADLVTTYRNQNPNLEHWVLWFDDDMIPPNNAAVCLLQSMLEHPEIGLLSGFCSRKEDMDPGLMFHPHDGSQMLAGRDYERGNIVEVMWCGMGFLLHKADVFDKIEKPYFQAGDLGASEDHHFTKRLADAGIIPYVHTGLVIGHALTTTMGIFSPYTVPALQKPKPKDTIALSNGHAEVKIEA